MQLANEEKARPPCDENGQIQRHIRRIERRCLLLSFTVLLLAIFCLRLEIRFRSVIEILGLISQRLNLICKQIDTIR